MRKSLSIAAACMVNAFVMAQQVKPADTDLERLVDEIFALQDEDINYEDLYENLVQLYENRADLNDVTEDQLRSVFVLNEAQIQAFLHYREEAGPFLSIYELQNIEGFNQDIIQRLVPFITVQDKTLQFNKHLLQRILNEKNNYLIIRYDRTLEEQKGYEVNTPPSARYAGSPDRIYTRFNTRRTGDFSLGFTAEKDAGERIKWAPQKKYYGADYVSFHAQVMNKGMVRNLIVGDYQAQFGQGLLLGSAFGIGKNSESVTTVRKGNIGFIPYTSVYEARFFRGAALSYSLSKHLMFHGMYSNRWRDGNIQRDTSESDFDFVTSLQMSGLHRTPTELVNRNMVRETNMAAIISHKSSRFESGVLLHHTRFNSSLIPNTSLYNQFAFRGKENTNAGLFMNYLWKNFAFFSEVAYSVHKGTGAIAGIIGSITPALDVALLARKFDRDFISFYSNALAENSSPQNETGFYWGWKYTFNKKYSLSGYADLFRFPWLRYRSYHPSDGSEWLIRFNHKPSRHITLFLQAREEIKVRNHSTDSNLYLTHTGTKRNYWFNIDYRVAPSLTFKTRIQYSTYDFSETHSDGMVLLQDFTWNYGKISISGRYALFDTDDYDNRQYVYEKDTWLAFSFPAYYGSGVRNYLLVQYSISKKADIWLRWARVRYNDRETIGSGSDTIEGNTRNDVKFQFRIRL